MTTEPFRQPALNGVAKALADAYSTTQIIELLDEARIPVAPTSGKKSIVADSVRARQEQDGSGNCVLLLVETAANPQAWAGDEDGFNALRDALNHVLIYDGLTVGEDGRISYTSPARTHKEAASRQRRMTNELVRRQGHEKVFAYCSSELLANDCFNAVFEAVKGLGDRLRKLTGLDLDGTKLVEQALEGKTPLLALNPLRTDSERSEQRGIAMLTKGCFTAFRNPPAHEPKQSWAINERDALDVLTLVSLIHRKLDDATPTTAPG